MISQIISYIVGIIAFIFPIILIRAQSSSNDTSKKSIIEKYLFPISLALFIGTLVVGFKIKQDIQTLIDETTETRRNLGYASRYEINATLNDIDSLKKTAEKILEFTHDEKKIATILKVDELILIVNSIKGHLEILGKIEDETVEHLKRMKESLQKTHKRLTPSAPASPEAVGFASKAVGA